MTRVVGVLGAIHLMSALHYVNQAINL